MKVLLYFCLGVLIGLAGLGLIEQVFLHRPLFASSASPRPSEQSLATAHHSKFQSALEALQKDYNNYDKQVEFLEQKNQATEAQLKTLQAAQPKKPAGTSPTLSTEALAAQFKELLNKLDKAKTLRQALDIYGQIAILQGKSMKALLSSPSLIKKAQEEIEKEMKESGKPMTEKERKKKEAGLVMQYMFEDPSAQVQFMQFGVATMQAFAKMAKFGVGMEQVTELTMYSPDILTHKNSLDSVASFGSFMSSDEHKPIEIKLTPEQKQQVETAYETTIEKVAALSQEPRILVRTQQSDSLFKEYENQWKQVTGHTPEELLSGDTSGKQSSTGNSANFTFGPPTYGSFINFDSTQSTTENVQAGSRDILQSWTKTFDLTSDQSQALQPLAQSLAEHSLTALNSSPTFKYSSFQLSDTERSQLLQLQIDAESHIAQYVKASTPEQQKKIEAGSARALIFYRK